MAKSGRAANSTKIETAGTETAGPGSDRLRPALPKDYAETTFTYRAGKTERTANVADLATLLGSDQGDQCFGQLNGLLQSDVPQYIVLLWRLVEAGEIAITPRARCFLRLFALRVYLSLNAVQTAYELGGGFLRDEELWSHLPSGEQTRVRHLLARSALRSGRANEAIALYADLFAESPASPFALMNLVNSASALRPEVAGRLAKAALDNNYDVSIGDLLFVGDLLTTFRDYDAAQTAVLRALQREPKGSDAHIGLANLALATADREQWARHIRRFFMMDTDLSIEVDDAEPLRPFSLQPQGTPRIGDHPKVTVVMTTFNSEATVRQAIESVLRQQLLNIELIVVDDASADGTVAILNDLSSRDSRIKILLNNDNVGTYVSKNRAIVESTGEFVTFHDSDDWMHPGRLVRHLATVDGNFVASTSSWIRMDSTGRVMIRRGGPYTHLNPASTFVRRSLFDRIGPFDSVRVGADAELLSRIRMNFGRTATKNIPTCLGIGFHHTNSLTQSGVAAFDDYRYSPTRVAYTESWLAWQLSELQLSGREIRLVHEQGSRQFPVPASISP